MMGQEDRKEVYTTRHKKRSEKNQEKNEKREG